MSNLCQPTALVGAIAISMGFSTSVSAQDSSNVVNASLETLVVTASRSEEKIKDVPARITVISKSDIEKNPTLNLSDLIQQDPSVYVKQSGGMGQISEIGLRGTKAVHTLVLKDAARLNSQNELGPLYPAFLDTSDIQQIEILKGPASVQYGSDAIGGVVQLISKKPVKSGAELTGIYGENNTYKTIAKADLFTDQGFYAQVGGQRLESDGTRIFESQDNSENASYDQKGYNAKVGYFQENQIDASASISENKGTSIFSNDYITNTAPRNFVNRVINAKVDYNILQNLILGAHFANVQDKQDVPSYFTQFNTENNQSDLNLKWKFTPNQNILLGATYNDANYKTSSIKNQDQSVNSAGYYLQHQFKNELFDTQVGLRVEDNELFGSHTVGQGAIRYHFLPNASVYANIGSAFRAPTLNELYSQWGGNDNLEPEESISYELGFDYAITDNLATSFSIYRTNVDNLIVYSDRMNQNVGEANFTGGEAGLKWKQDDLFLATEYAYVETENKATGLEIAYRPKQTLSFTAGLENAVYGLTTSVIARSHANASNNANSVKVPGYATVDFNAYWNINPNVKVFTNIQNLWDNQYHQVSRSATDWYINGGRLASAGVTFRY